MLMKVSSSASRIICGSWTRQGHKTFQCYNRCEGCCLRSWQGECLCDEVV